MNLPSLDRTDRQLLALLQQNNRRTLRDLADALAISAPTCLRRMRRLESRGVIRAHVALLDARLLGLSVSAYVEISLANASGAEMSAFERRMSRHPEVIRCAEIAGDVDYLLTVVVRDMTAFSQFTRRAFAEDRRIRAYRSLLVMRHTKDEHALPLG